ncbi:hypothetical protein [Dysgonomonas sp. BGC7]|uniref:hypothetical protein n=1 Tax=Dysgonomonas sp. BGC7 TaxID=1658008 RepID=UPI00068309BF|nr:hypothetical protein [Dysgonomonas sp. BGC7]MBD8389649.1 hypothetical protein [Dysgonomonas sp. BGC7]
MKYNDLIDKLGKVVEESKLLLRIDSDVIAIEGKFFHESTINKIQRLLQLYGECQWWIYPSLTIQDGVMYTIKIYQYK